MITSEYRPLLKHNIEILPAKDQERDMIIIRDSEGIVEKTLIMPAESIVLLQFFNGENSIKDIRSLILKLTGEVISESDIIDFVKQIEDAGYLEGEKTNRLREKVFSEFKNSSIRKVIHKGLSYPENILELSSFMSKFLKLDNKNIPLYSYKGLIAPHIDLIRGGRVYSSGYGEISKSELPDTVIAFGTSHRGGNSPFIITQKDYETPYGIIETDKELYSKFKDILWYEPDEEDFFHRNEHSLEFQALWLKYIWREKTPRWLAILTSRYERFAQDQPPSKIENIEKMFKDMEDLIREISKNKKIMIIAGADFSHVGPRFGDNIQITQSVKSEIEKKDREKIEYILNLDADGFYMSVMSEKNSTKICGLSPIYATLRALRAVEGEKKPKLLDYAQADDPFGGFVSFASIVF